MKNFVREYKTVNIEGKDYNLRELSLAEKNKLLGTIGEFIRNITNNIFFKKNDEGGFSVNFIDEISLAELNVDKIILSAVDVFPELLKLSVPDFKDWDNLPESEARDVLLKAVEAQDFKGYISNFFLLGKSLIL